MKNSPAKQGEASVSLQGGNIKMSNQTADIAANTFDWKKLLFLLIGVILFAVVYYSAAMARCRRSRG